MKSDYEVVAACLPELSETAQADLDILIANLIRRMDERAVGTKTYGKSGFGRMCALELIGVLIRSGYLPMNNPAAIETRKKNERLWQTGASNG
jgi:hypothetical protein